MVMNWSFLTAEVAEFAEKNKGLSAFFADSAVNTWKKSMELAILTR